MSRYVVLLALVLTLPILAQHPTDTTPGAVVTTGASDACQQRFDELTSQVEIIRADVAKLKTSVERVAVTSIGTRSDVLALDAAARQRLLDLKRDQAENMRLTRERYDSLMRTVVQCFATVLFGLIAKFATDWRARSRATAETRKHRAIELETLTEIAALGIQMPKRSEHL